MKIVSINKKIDGLQSVRAFAFLMVFVQHLGILPNMPLGGMGVSQFIVLSGFLMVYQYYEKSEGLPTTFESSVKFGFKKIKKLYPLHIITVCIALFLEAIKIVLHQSENSLILLLLRTASCGSLLHAFVPVESIFFSFPIISVSWYLSASILFYCCFPHLLRWIRANEDRTVLAAAVATYIAMIFFVGITVVVFRDNRGLRTYFSYVFPGLRLGDFFIGCCFGRLYLNNFGKLEGKNTSIIEVFVVILLSATVMLLNANSSNVLSAVFSESVVACLPSSVFVVVLFAYNSGFITRFLTNRVTIYLGDISAYGYLIHNVVIYCIHLCFDYALPNLSSPTVKYALAIVITWLSIVVYRYQCEKKVENLESRSQ